MSDVTTGEVMCDAVFAAAASERTGTITVLSGQQVGAVFVVGDTGAVIGREAADIVIADAGVSRAHARIVRCGNQYELEDLSSRNGTYLASERVQGRVRLTDGMRFRVANTLLSFTEQDLLAAVTSQGIYQQSTRDEMTGLYNRRYLDARLETDLASATAHGTALCLILCDIDHLRRVNERFGHPAGDEVLRRVAKALVAGTRPEDVVARAGGELFAVIVRDVDGEGAYEEAERIRELVQLTAIEWQGARIPITLSAGIATHGERTHYRSLAALFAAADNALYAAKHAGRNRSHLSIVQQLPPHYGVSL